MKRFVLGLCLLAGPFGCAASFKAEAASAPPSSPTGQSAGVPAPEKAASADSLDAAPSQMVAAYPQVLAKDGASAERPVAAAPSKQQLVYTADFTLSVYQVDLGLDKTEAIARELGGYLSLRGDSGITVRVPREKFREALGRVETLGDVIHRDVKAIDVTDEYVDLQSRLENARTMRDHLQTLLAKAAVKDALEIEKELGRVTEQIELMEGKLKGLSDRIQYSTITVHYTAKGNGSTRPSFRLPFGWVQALGVHRLLEFQPRPE